MADQTLNPTSVTSPDPGQGGSAVTSPIATGHSTSTSSAEGQGIITTKTCIWSGFPEASGTLARAFLRVGYNYTGLLEDGGIETSNAVGIEYSLDGGSSWLNLLIDANFTGSQSGTASAALPVGQDPTLVKVRDNIEAQGGGDEPDPQLATASMAVSNIRIEITFGANRVMLGMM